MYLDDYGTIYCLGSRSRRQHVRDWRTVPYGCCAHVNRPPLNRQESSHAISQIVVSSYSRVPKSKETDVAFVQREG